MRLSLRYGYAGNARPGIRQGLKNAGNAAAGICALRGKRAGSRNNLYLSGNRMVEFTPIESLVIQAMKDIGAINEEKKKTADDIAKKCNRPKSMVNNALVALITKGTIKRVAREKAAGYYLIAQ